MRKLTFAEHGEVKDARDAAFSRSDFSEYYSESRGLPFDTSFKCCNGRTSKKTKQQKGENAGTEQPQIVVNTFERNEQKEYTAKEIK